MSKSTRLVGAVAALGLPLAALAGPEDTKQPVLPQWQEAASFDLSEYAETWTQPKLWYGDAAPKLAIAEFIRGESFQEFEDDRVYVVEFWATWCGPCVAAFPHMSELQNEYKEDVTFIGVNIWDTNREPTTREYSESQGERARRVREFVTEGEGRAMRYTVAIEDGVEGMSSTWMTPAGRNGIPSAFIVDGDGRIAWMGHPMGMDEPLEQVVNDSWNAAAEGERAAEAAREKAREAGPVNGAHKAFVTGLGSEDRAKATKAYRVGRALAVQHGWDNPQLLNSLSWSVIDPEATVPHPDIGFALTIAERAADLTGYEDPMILDTLALAMFEFGDVDGAIKTQKRAIELLDGDRYLADFRARLAEFEAAGD